MGACKPSGILVIIPRLIGVRKGGKKRGREGGWRVREGRGEVGAAGGGLDGRKRPGDGRSKGWRVLGQPRRRGGGVEERERRGENEMKREKEGEFRYL